MRPHGPAGVVFVADHLCIKKRNNLVLLLITCVQKKTIWFLLLITCVTKKTIWFSFFTRWFLVANAVVFVYSVLGAVISCCSICVRRGPLSYSPTAWLTFLVDFVSPTIYFRLGLAAGWFWPSIFA